MKIFISADIEGVAGVVHGEQGRQHNSEYETARRLMAKEVNAAIEGAIAGGASEVLVNDSHGYMRNLIPTDIDARAELVSGFLKPMSMLQGIDDSFDAVMLVGFHSRAGGAGLLAHTISGFAFARVTINGQDVGETFLYGALAGTLGVPVILITGDDQLRAETATDFPAAMFAQVKTAYGAQAGRSLSPAAAGDLIRRSAEAAVRAIAAAKPFLVAPPLTCEVQFNQPAMADLVCLLPMCERLNPTRIRFTSETIGETIRLLIAMSAMVTMLR